MNLLDWVLVILVCAYALSGYWQGFIAGAFATVGLVLGGLIGIWLAPHLLGGLHGSVWVSIGALFVVLVCASLGQAVLQYVGVQVRSGVTWQPARALDAVGGAVLSVIAVLCVMWMLGVAVSGSDIPGISGEVRDSAILKKVNSMMPPEAQNALRSFNNVVGDSFFPRYLEPFAPEYIPHVKAAPAWVLRDPGVVRAASSIYKIRGNNACGDGVEGSGFLYAPHRIMTNAHVVAGVRDVQVLVGSSFQPATVVYYNPRIDVAVLRVRSVRAMVLRFDKSGHAREIGVALGYPEDGPYNAQPARIRGSQRLRSPNIYSAGSVTRDVFSLRADIRPGNSGGPLIGTDGRVLGVIFAASVTSEQTGYALTADQVAAAAAQGITHSKAVSTQGCA